MAQFTKVHGDFQPVLHLDAPEYQVGALNAVTANATVQPQGPKLDFFTIELADVTSNTTIASQVVLTVQELATVYIYEFSDVGNAALNVAVYPTGAWTDTSLKTAVDAATGGTSTVYNYATFTN